MTAIHRPTENQRDLQTLVAAFKTEPVFWRQAEIAKDIARAGDQLVLTELDEWLSHHDRHVRANVAYIFAALDDRRGFDVLVGILSDHSDRVEGQGIPGGRWSLRGQIEADRYYAVHVLGELKGERAVDILLPLLADPQIDYKVATALGQLGDARAIDGLVVALRNRNALTRLTAILALEQLKATQAIPYLHDLLQDDARPSGDTTIGERARRAIQLLEGRC